MNVHTHRDDTVTHHGKIGRVSKHYRLAGRWIGQHGQPARVNQPPYLDVLVIDGKAWETSLGTVDLDEPPLFLTPDGEIMVAGLAVFIPAIDELQRAGIA